ncbi:ankyrin repeat and fibronectin type-III domain-containing protein 1-like isoform X3 [Clytia hemisphaerica]|uniref:Ankyrin repeat and fibronectin type-III domain-containing protein 1 n=1 Tax=Clytia hemisphaerica TaxID=252671 RepID=A0A7M5U1S4_9CNID
MITMETKASIRLRKFSWTKTHSIHKPNNQPQSSNPITLKRSGSMNNIVLGLRSEAAVNNTKFEKKRRTQTFRSKRKNRSKSRDELSMQDACVNLANLSMLAPLVTIPNDASRIVSDHTGHDTTDSPDSNHHLRRRASSLDFLPEAINNSKVIQQAQQQYAQQNGGTQANHNNKASSPFARTTSMSQRSPFRKKVSYQAEQADNSISGVRELRPKGLKRSKSGLDALFDAIERQEFSEVRRLITVHDVSLNELNGDSFTPLDVALMLNETDISNLLLHYGAKENPAFHEPKERTSHLESLMETAEENVNNYKTTLLNYTGDTKENERQLREWEWRLYFLRIMQNGFTNAEPPSQPPIISTAPLSSDSIVVTLNAPTSRENDTKEVITKYRVEWSKDENFNTMEGHELLEDKRHLCCTIPSLPKNTTLYVRAQSGNHKGFSMYGYPEPRSVSPSSWHELDNSLPRYHGVSDKLHHLVDDVLSVSRKQSDKSSDDGSDEDTPPCEAPPVRSPKTKNPSRKLVKSMSKYTNLIFNSAPKLLKKIKGRGIYLAALLYNTDQSKVLVTMDENLPVVECDDNHAKLFNQEFYWFSKTSCTWEDIQHMLYTSTKSHSSQSVHIRRKLLESALVLMNATGVNDLGPIHDKPFRDEHGSVLLLAVNCVKKISSSKTMTMKWIPVQKFLKKSTHSSNSDSVMVPERLIPCVQEQVCAHEGSRTKLPKGLYLGYLKLRTSMDTLSIIVPNAHTNVLPHVKIQDVPNVTKDQWQWLKSFNDINGLVSHTKESTQSESMFERRLKIAIRKLFNALNISTDVALSHRVYDQEVIELDSDVMFILIFPNEVCTPPNQSDNFSSSSAYSALPVQSFEMNNMMTYQPKLMSSYCRLSSILELENLSVQQAIRESICHDETRTLKNKQSRLSNYQQNVDDLWKVSRWIFDTLQSCQEKNLNVGVPLNTLFGVTSWCDVINNRLSLTSQASVNSIPCALSDRERDSESISSTETSNELPSPTSPSATATVTTPVSLKIYGTEEIGFQATKYTTVTVDDNTTALDIVLLAARQFLSEPESLNSEPIKELLSEKNLKNLALVVVAGSRERVLRDELHLLKLQNPWEKGTIYLRLKKEAIRATKWGLSTTV